MPTTGFDRLARSKQVWNPQSCGTAPTIHAGPDHSRRDLTTKGLSRVKTIPRAERTVLALIWLLLDRDLRLRLSREHSQLPLSPDQAWGRAWTRHSSKEARAASLPLACPCAFGASGYASMRRRFESRGRRGPRHLIASATWCEQPRACLDCYLVRMVPRPISRVTYSFSRWEGSQAAVEPAPAHQCGRRGCCIESRIRP
jgi:hypothetical protein